MSAWLSQEEQEEWVAFVLATRLLWRQFEQDLQRSAGMPLAYYEVLSLLSEVRGWAMRMSDLSVILQLSPSRLSHAVSRLEDAGWVRREVCPSDRRGWLAVLTETGMAALEAAAPVHVESVRRHLFDQLAPAQREHLGAISQALISHLAPGLDLSRAIARGKTEGPEAAEDWQSLPPVDP
jgi:DNA-binding MarR family transcriptional regulator